MQAATVAVIERNGHLPLDFAAATALSSLFRAANAARDHPINAVLREHGLSQAGYVVLRSVWIADGLEARQAAASAAIPNSTLTGVAKTLVRRGWLVRQASWTDRRQIHLRLTAQGLALMEELYPRVSAAEAEVVARIHAAALPRLADYLHTVAASAEDAETAAGLTT